MENKRIDQPKPEKAPPPGFPGYRTEPGRSGLDYIDSSRELAFMEGKFIRSLFTGRLRTRNRLYQILMLCLGLALLLPAVALLVELAGDVLSGTLCFILPMGVVGIAFLYNAIQSIWIAKAVTDDETAEPRGSSPARPKRQGGRRKTRFGGPDRGD